MVAVVVLLPGLAAGCAWKPRRSATQESVVNCRHLSQQGLSAIERGDWAEAERYLSQATKTCPVDAEARQHLADALWQRGKRDEAVAQLEQAIHLEADDPQLHTRMAQLRLEQGDAAAARRSIDQAIDLDPKSAAGWAIRGQIVLQQGQPHQAIADFNRALSLDPQNRTALVSIAELHLAHGQPQRALAHLQSLEDTYAAGEQPQRVYYLLGLAHLALRRPADAIAQLQAAQSHGPASSEILARLAEAQLQTGQLDQAEASAQRSVAAQGDYAPGRAVLEQVQQARRQGDLRQR